ncbi:uncharacterized protein G2W53_018203 [Senna tora]|uniref:Uncharacterized protein n=1 Tax=Senna tora TaxID=362788 RepID=A0A834U048_9FABA|nr:uncharacterized protein G2W53_018203 [Senna tora]
MPHIVKNHQTEKSSKKEREREEKDKDETKEEEDLPNIRPHNYHTILPNNKKEELYTKEGEEISMDAKAKKL